MSERLSDSDIQEMLSGFDVTRMVGRALIELQERRASDKQEPKPEPLSGVALAEAACRVCGIECQRIGRQFAPHVNLPDALWLWGMKLDDMADAGYRVRQVLNQFVVERSERWAWRQLGTGPEVICRALVEALGKPEHGSTS
jgi:hypothetical protein